MVTVFDIVQEYPPPPPPPPLPLPPLFHRATSLAWSSGLKKLSINYCTVFSLLPLTAILYLWNGFIAYKPLQCRQRNLHHSQTLGVTAQQKCLDDLIFWCYHWKRPDSIDIVWYTIEFFGPQVMTVEAQSPVLQLFHMMGKGWENFTLSPR